MADDNNIKSFNKVKAEKENDCRFISVVDLLEELLEEAKSGDYNFQKCVVLLVDEDSETTPKKGKRWRMIMRASGVSKLEFCGMIMNAIIEEADMHIAGYPGYD